MYNVYLLHSGLIIYCQKIIVIVVCRNVDISNQFINIAVKFVSSNSRWEDVSIVVIDIVPVPLLILPIIILILDVVIIVTLRSIPRSSRRRDRT